MMHGPEKSHSSIVARKPANKLEPSSAELVEPREGTEGNADKPDMPRTPSRTSMTQGLERVRQAAKGRKRNGSRRFCIM
jgi:RNA-directed DNA polymerase